MQNSLDPHYLKNIYQIHILINQFLSFYKVTFVEEGIDKLDIIAIFDTFHQLYSFLLKEYSKNIDNQSKIKSLNYIIDR